LSRLERKHSHSAVLGTIDMVSQESSNWIKEKRNAGDDSNDELKQNICSFLATDSSSLIFE
jgi:hypothetical protein